MNISDSVRLQIPPFWPIIYQEKGSFKVVSNRKGSRYTLFGGYATMPIIDLD
jgi:hypothetical protein